MTQAERPEDVLRWAILAHRPDRVFACFSGGHDSLVSSHFAMNHGAEEVLHINTGIGIKETRQFVRDTCLDHDWKLREEYPPAKTYRDFVLKYGFPGPAAHRYAYSWLKERAIRKVVRESKKSPNGTVMFVTGVRIQESARRMGFVEPIQRAGAIIWVAPMYGWSKDECNAYIEEQKLERNRVVELMKMSGECLCGAFAKPGEMAKLEILFPETAAEIRTLEAEVEAAGKPCKWGIGGKKQPSDKLMPMCVGCEQNNLFEPLS